MGRSTCGRKSYSKQKLISELQRFYNGNGRVPTQLDMQVKFGYPSAGAYRKPFGTFNSALKIANLDLNQYHNCWQDGTETCDNCGKQKNKSTKWAYVDGKRLCHICRKRNESSYKKGVLSAESTCGFAFRAQRLVIKYLKLDDEYDCNLSDGFSSSFDIYDKNKYGKIDVKAATLQKDGRWRFNFYNKENPDTYILIAFDSNRSEIIYVWLIHPNDEPIKNRCAITIKLGFNTPSLEKMYKYLFDYKSFNEIWQNMSLVNCEYLKK